MSENLEIKFQPKDLLEIFTNAEENNIREIQNLHDQEDELESVRKLERKEDSELEKLVKENEERISDLQKKYDRKNFECTKLR